MKIRKVKSATLREKSLNPLPPPYTKYPDTPAKYSPHVPSAEPPKSLNFFPPSLLKFTRNSPNDPAKNSPVAPAKNPPNTPYLPAYPPHAPYAGGYQAQTTSLCHPISEKQPIRGQLATKIHQE